MRLVDADEMERHAYNDLHYNAELENWEFDMLTHYLDLAPTIDAVPVVRCKDCKHCVDAHDDGFMYCMRPIEAPDYSETGYCYPLEVRVGFYGFCSYGERKDGEG